MYDLFTKPGVKNFLLLLIIWYLCITIYSILGMSPYSMLYRYEFYTKFSWPNFVLIYFLIIWIIPNSFNGNKLLKLIALTFVALIVFIAIRYINNSFWEKDYYYSYDSQNIKYKLSFIRILAWETDRGILFIFLGYAFRLIIDRIKTESDKRKIEQEKIKAELAILHSQLNPHFLFNVFNSIYSMALKKSERTPDAILKLTETFRYILRKNGESVTIGDEIEHIKRLLDFERIRYPKAVIQLDIRVDEKQMQTPITPLLFSPFIENVLKHGDPGTEETPISILIEINNDEIIFSVKNPVATSQTLLLEESDNQQGLKNLQKRLELIYPNRFVLKTKKSNNSFSAYLSIKNSN